MGQVVRFSLMAALLWLLTGCQSSEPIYVDTIRPTATPAVHLGTSAAAVKLAIRPFAVAGPVSERNVIGEAKTGFFNIATEIICQESVGAIFAAAFRDALTGAGLSVTEEESADFVLQGTVQKFWVEEYATGYSPERANAYVKCEVLLYDANGRNKWGCSLNILKRSPTCFDATVQDIPTLTVALQLAVEKALSFERFWKTMGLQTTPDSPPPPEEHDKQRSRRPQYISARSSDAGPALLQASSGDTCRRGGAARLSR